MADYEIRELCAEDEPALLATFNEVFDEDQKEVGPREPEHWRWAYRKNPAGLRVFVAVTGGQVVAQYAGLPRRVWIDARESCFTQIVDSMVHPAHRAGLKRPGLFVNTALPFFEAYGGPGKDLVHYGWPNEAAWRIGQEYLGYEVVRTQTLLVWEPRGARTSWPGAVARLTRFDHQAKWLWDRCAGEWGASTIRDDAYLNWRLIDHPKQCYTIAAVHDAQGVLRGCAALWTGPWIVGRVSAIVEWLVPHGEPEVGELLLEAAWALTRAEESRALITLVPDWSPWFERFQRHGFLVHPSEFVLVARPFARRFDPIWLRDAWWYQLSDADLV
jgi:hypothetical protein